MSRYSPLQCAAKLVLHLMSPQCIFPPPSLTADVMEDGGKTNNIISCHWVYIQICCRGEEFKNRDAGLADSFSDHAGKGRTVRNQERDVLGANQNMKIEIQMSYLGSLAIVRPFATTDWASLF